MKKKKNPTLSAQSKYMKSTCSSFSLGMKRVYSYVQYLNFSCTAQGTGIYLASLGAYMELLGDNGYSSLN
jgi:ATP phosphoribosyltransferase regulatory subunit HisZ